jgi:hypothetical protein
MKRLIPAFSLLWCIMLTARINALEVMYWCDSYGVGQDLNYINDIPNLKDALTAVSLQWWQPSADGSSAGTGLTGSISQYTSTYHAVGVKVFLCVYNCSTFWDWNWAMSAYKENKDQFINSLVSQCEQYDLDGVDIDFEGGTQAGGDAALQLERVPFAEFCRDLGTQLHALGKELSICSFHSPCWNAPNMSWWPDWIGYVDHARLMGYWDDYESSERELLDEGTCWGLPDATKPTRYFKYSWKSEWGLECGFDSTVVSIGMPAENGMDNWGGQGCQAHIQDNLNLPSPMGVCIWESELAGAWKDGATWALLKQIHDINPPHSNIPTITRRSQGPEKENFGISITNSRMKIVTDHPGEYSIALFDLSGRRLHMMTKRNFQSGANSISLNNVKIPAGVYVAKITGAEKTIVQKVELQ